MSLKKYCPRCGRLMDYGKSYCDDCLPITEEQRRKRIEASKKKYNRRYNRKRDPKYLRFYHSIEWKALSQVYSQRMGYRCEQCGEIASQVHHVKPIQTEEGWKARLDPDNLELLCTKCHNERHGRFRKKRKYFEKN